MASKRHDPNYMQIGGYIPKELALKFKSVCVVQEVSISEVLEQVIRKELAVNKGTQVQEALTLTNAEPSR